ncbi:tetratricopeptide repeat-containing sensor histidine kinase [Pedobacter sp. ASV28]|uniref:tetratricopeptide repeat-containing sensor histidine kinase n=1 Tax=Pedobacter sp. ASV28 TaxID=2795123 RepID=UPI0018EAACC9|nr:tetratricopeptide repeat-containing sensor histidine kinase [Pedobacter sp. ASV28]
MPFPIPKPDPLCAFLKLIFYGLIFSSVMGCGRNTAPQDMTEAKVDQIIIEANRLQNDGHLQRSIYYVDSALGTFAHLEPMALWKKYNFKSNHYLNYHVQLEKAGQYVDSMKLMLRDKEASHKEMYALTLFADADVLMAKRRYNEAFQCYYEGRLFAQNNLDSCAYSRFSHHLGIVKYNQGQYLKAIPYVKQAIIESRSCKTDFFSAVAEPQAFLNTIALCYEKAGKLDSATYYYHSALDLLDSSMLVFPEHEDFIWSAKGVVYGNLGGAYGQLEQTALAEKYLKESIRINDRPGYEISDALTAKLKLARLLISTRRYPEAAAQLLDIGQGIAWHQKQHKPIDQSRMQWYWLKWVYADSTRHPLLAYQYSKQYYQLRDSLSAVNQDLLQSDMDKAFQISDQKYNLSLLDQDKRLKEMLLLAAMILGLMAIVMVIVIWRNLKRSKSHVAGLTHLNKQIRLRNRQMHKILSDLEQSQAENTKMMKIVAHDLRNPIEGIASITDMMLSEGERSKSERTMLELISSAGKNALELVDQLLQVHSETETLKREMIDLEQLLQYCVDLLKHKAEAKRQIINLEGSKVKVLANREKLWRVLSNLITNAIKFSPENTAIHVKIESGTKQVLVSVEDQGIGIPIEMQAKVFDMFTEAKRPGTAGEKTFGLGLAISKQILDLHQGKIWLESTPGKGTIFFVELPLNP